MIAATAVDSQKSFKHRLILLGGDYPSDGGEA